MRQTYRKFFCQDNKEKSEEYHFIVHLQISRGNQNTFTSKIKYLIERCNQVQKSLLLVVDINLNSLDCTTNNHVQFFLSFFWKLYFSLRIMKTSATAIIHILTNSVLNFEVQNEIIKNDISDFFVIFFFSWGQP